MTPRLHCFGESGNCYKAALTLALTGTAWEPVFVDFFHGAARTPAWRDLNVMGEAPVLVTEDRTLTQSGAIQLWAAERSGHLLGDRYESLRWVLFDNHKVSGVAGALRFHMNFLPPDKRSQAVIDWLTPRLLSALAALEAQLSRTPFLTGEAPTIADTACCGYLYYPEPFGFDRKTFPAVDAWLSRLAALPGWAHPYDLMPRVPGRSPTLPLA